MCNTVYYCRYILNLSFCERIHGKRKKKHHQRASFGNITNGIYGRYIECFTHMLSNGTPMVCIVVLTPLYSHSNKMKLYRHILLQNSYSHETFLVIKLNTNTTPLIVCWSNSLLMAKNDWDARVGRKVKQALVGENGFCYTLISSREAPFSYIFKLETPVLLDNLCSIKMRSKK